MKLSEVAEALEGTLHGDGAVEVARVVHPAEVERPTDLALALDKAMLRARNYTNCIAIAILPTANEPLIPPVPIYPRLVRFLPK